MDTVMPKTVGRTWLWDKQQAFELSTLDLREPVSGLPWECSLLNVLGSPLGVTSLEDSRGPVSAPEPFRASFGSQIPNLQEAWLHLSSWSREPAETPSVKCRAIWTHRSRAKEGEVAEGWMRAKAHLARATVFPHKHLCQPVPLYK